MLGGSRYILMKPYPSTNVAKHGSKQKIIQNSMYGIVIVIQNNRSKDFVSGDQHKPPVPHNL